MNWSKFKTAFAFILGFATAGFTRSAQAEIVSVVDKDNTSTVDQYVEIDSMKLDELERAEVIVRNSETSKPEIDRTSIENLEKSGVLTRSRVGASVECPD